MNTLNALKPALSKAGLVILILSSILVYYLFEFLSLKTPPYSVISILYFLTIPGYSFTDLFFSQLDKLDKLLLSLGISFSLLTTVKALLQVLIQGRYVSYLVSDKTVLIVFSILLLSSNLLRKVDVLEFLGRLS